MQSVSSRIWTRVAVSTSYDDNHYTIGKGINAMWYVNSLVQYLNLVRRLHFLAPWPLHHERNRIYDYRFNLFF